MQIVENYKVLDNGTSYHIETSDEMIKILEGIRLDGKRCRFHWGNTETGEDWGDIYDVWGTIGRSNGRFKVPLLIYNRRSYGGRAILTHCIVRIEYKGRDIYKHPNYHVKEVLA